MTDVIIHSYEVGSSKPDRRIYEIACEHLDVQSQEMIYLDDVQAYVDAACDIGIQGTLFTSTEHAVASIERRLR